MKNIDASSLNFQLSETAFPPSHHFVGLKPFLALKLVGRMNYVTLSIGWNWRCRCITVRQTMEIGGKRKKVMGGGEEAFREN